jgi:hypothetical protein
MVCVASVLVKTAAFQQGTTNDVSTAKMQLEGTYDHILHLDIAVELSRGTFLRYHAMEEKTLWKKSAEKTKVTNENESRCCDDKTFFDAYENLPTFHEEFFDCFEEE